MTDPLDRLDRKRPVPFADEVEGAPPKDATDRRARTDGQPVLPDYGIDPVAIANLAPPSGAAAPGPTLDALRKSNNVAPPGHGAPLGSYLDALTARESHAHAPKGVPTEVWALTSALVHESISAEDARTFAATGTLPDQKGPHGEVVKTGAQRLAALEGAAEGHGSWTAVNSLTCLVGMRRAVLASERGAGKTDPKDSLAVDAQLGKRLQQTYFRATHAREASSAHALARAGELTAKAAAATSVAEKDKLTKEAEQLRIESAKGALAEARYRASQPKSGFDPSTAYALAEDAQVANARVEIAKNQQQGWTVPAPPATLGNAADAGNGVPGAERIAIEAQEKVPNPKPAAKIALSRSEAHRYDALATFHAGRDRAAYVDARVRQMDALAGQIRAHEQSGATDPQSTFEEIGAHATKRQVEDELAAVFAKVNASARAVDDANAAKQALAAGVKTLPQAVTAAENDLEQEKSQLGTAQDDNKAIWDLRAEKTRARDQRLVDNRTIEVADGTAALDRAKAAVAAAPAAAKRLGEAADALGQRWDRDRADAARVSKALGYDPTEAYQTLRKAADGDRDREEALLARVDKPGKNTSAEARQIVAARSELARSYAHTVELGELALGKAASASDQQNLIAKAHNALAQADAQRTELAKGSPGRAVATATFVEALSEVAVTTATRTPGRTVRELAYAEKVTTEDLEGPAADAARTHIGMAAVIGYVRHDAVLVDVARTGQHDPKADDALVAQGKRLLASADERTPGVKEANALLAKRERDLDSFKQGLEASAKELSRGNRYAKAKIEDLAVGEGKLARNRISGLAQGVAYGATLGDYDAREEMMDAAQENGAAATRRLDASTVSLTAGASDLARAFDQARAEGRASELMGALRIASDRDVGQSRDTTQLTASLSTLGRFNASSDAVWYISVGLRGAANGKGGFDPPASTIGQSLVSGGTLGLEARVSAQLALPGVSSITPAASQAMVAQGESLAAEAHDALYFTTANTFLTAILGARLTAGLGSAAAVGEAGAAANAGRVGLSAVSSARAAVSAFTAARPVLGAIGTAAAWGAAGAGASWAARKAFGADSWAANAVDVGANFIPAGRAQAAAGLGRAVGVGAQLGEAAVSFGHVAAQVAATQLGVPWLADQVGVNSEAGRTAMSVAMGALVAGGLTASTRGVTRARAQSELLARQLATLENVTPAKAESARVEIERFLESNESKIPSNEELLTLRSRIASTLDMPSLSGPVTLDAVVESIRVDRACAVTLREAGNPATLRAADLEAVMRKTRERLDSSRGTTGTSSARDTLEGMGPALAAMPPEVAKEAVASFVEGVTSTERPGTAPLPTERQTSPSTISPWREAVRPENTDLAESLTQSAFDGIKRRQDVAVDLVLRAFPPEVRAAAKLSPTLRWQISALAAEGVRVYAGKPGEGSMAIRPLPEQRGPTCIVVDPMQPPGQAALSVAHEAAHVLYNFPNSVAFDAVSKRTYVDIQKGRSMADEGNSILNEHIVRREIVASGGADPGSVRGLPREAAVVLDAFSRGDLSRSTAVDLLAQYVQQLRVGIGDHASYDTYYGDDWAGRYDRHVVGGAATQDAPAP